MSANPDSAWFLQEADQLVKKANDEGLTIRVIGAVAVRTHCPNFALMHSKLKRLETGDFTDLDFMTTHKYSDKLPSFFAKHNYEKQAGGVGLAVQGFGRQMYVGSNGIKIDVFADQLVMCHTIDFRNRLELDSPTITLADILLEKIQIVEINMKDVKDVIVLLREHPVGNTNKEEVDAKYVSRLLANEWGFYYTATENLRKIRNHLDKVDGNVVSDEDKQDVDAKIGLLLDSIEAESKSFQWKMRARLGTKAKWYNDVVGAT